MYDKPFHRQDLSGYTFLVTGGAGFIGSNIVEYLLKYNAGKVVVLDNLATGFESNIKPFLSNPAVHLIKGDITRRSDCEEACKGVDFVSHQAALGSVPRSIKDPAATHAANATGFLNMLVAARDAGVKRFVYASSSSVYGDSPALPKKEEHSGNLLSPYAVTKKMNEYYGNVFHRVYGMNAIGLRYFNVFGPRQNPAGPYAAAIPLFMEAMLTGKTAYINGDGEQSRDFTFVENAVQANIKAFFTEHSSAPGGIFNIAAGERTTLNQLFNYLREISGQQIQPVYREERPGDIRHSHADISLAEKALGYDPRIRVDEGLRITFQWFKTALHNISA